MWLMKNKTNLGKNITTIFFATDIHGSEICFKKFINSGDYYKADVIILGGDVTFKAIIPIIKHSDNSYDYNIFGKKNIIKNKKELIRVQEKTRNIGFYPYILSESEFDDLMKEDSNLDELFKKLLISNMSKWVKYADEKLKNMKTKCYINLGNDDSTIIIPILKKSEFIDIPDDKVIKIDNNHEMVSLGYSNKTPWNTFRELSEIELEQKLENMIKNVKDLNNCIFNVHIPPFNSGLDECVELDKDLSPVLDLGKPVMKSAGSTAVRKVIEKYQPLLGLFGHIHEARGITRIGRTLCVNPGSSYQEGILQGFLAKINKEKILNYQLVSG